MTDNSLSASDKVERRVIYLAPIGQHTRHMLAGYLRHVFIVTAVLLAIALTIDLWPQLSIVAESRGRGALIGIWSVARFSALRTPGLVAPFFPFTTFLGVVWTEVTHTRSGERVLVWNSGRSPIHCLAPVVALSVLLGAVEFSMDAYLGPATMAVQMHERLGLDGQRLDRTRREANHWIVSPTGLLSAQIEYGPPPVLHNLTFFKRDETGQLTEVEMAAVARQLPGARLWLLRDGRYWTPALPFESDGAGSTPILDNSSGERMVPFSTRTVTLDLDPLWLSVLGMETQYLPMSVLTRLARADTGPLAKGLYRTRLQALYAETVLPGAMALLASLLSLVLLAYAASWRRVFGIVFVGYLAHFGSKVCLLMGQNGYMPPLVAGWFVPLALTAAACVILLVIERQRRGADR